MRRRHSPSGRCRFILRLLALYLLLPGWGHLWAQSGSFLETLSQTSLEGSSDSPETGASSVLPRVPGEGPGKAEELDRSVVPPGHGPAPGSGLGAPAPQRAPLPGDTFQPPQGFEALREDLRQRFGVTAGQGAHPWTERELRAVWQTLASLPACFRESTTTVLLEKKRSTIKGWVMRPTRIIHLTTTAIQPGTFQRTLVHEMGHCFENVHPKVIDAFTGEYWPGGKLKSRSVTQYGCTKPREDFCECCKLYWAEGPMMKRRFPDRYDFMKQHVFGGREYPASE